MGQYISNIFENNYNQNSNYKINSNSIPKIYLKANARIYNNEGTMIHGDIKFAQDLEGNVYVYGDLYGLPPGKKGFHVHQNNNPGECCSLNGLGGHYNPFNKQHGPRTIMYMGKEIINHDRHVGDLGNIIVKPDGTAKFKFVDNLLKLDGEYSIMNRSVIIHEDEDDLGFGNHSDSKTTGHSGKRQFYGIISKINN